MACFSHWWTTTWSVTGSISATRAAPVSSRSMASVTTASASVSLGPSSPARGHNASIWDWRSAMAQTLALGPVGAGRNQEARPRSRHVHASGPESRSSRDSRSATRRRRSMGWTTATRTNPAPSGP